MKLYSWTQRPLSSLTALALATVIFSVPLTGCSGNRKPSLKTDYDTAVDFTGYKTFRFGESRVLRKNSNMPSDNTIMVNRIHRAITESLKKRGLTPAAEGQTADLLVTFTAGAMTKEETYPVNTGVSVSAPVTPGFWWTTSTTTWFQTRSYNQATLVVDLTDIKNGQLVWRALLSGQLERTPDDATVQKGTDYIFKDFPPTKKP